MASELAGWMSLLKDVVTAFELAETESQWESDHHQMWSGWCLFTSPLSLFYLFGRASHKEVESAGLSPHTQQNNKKGCLTIISII